MEDSEAMNQDGILPQTAVETRAEPRDEASTLLSCQPSDERVRVPSARPDLFAKLPVESFPSAEEAAANTLDCEEASSKGQDDDVPEKTVPAGDPVSRAARMRKHGIPPPFAPIFQTKKRKAPLLVGTMDGSSARKNGKADAEGFPRSPADPIGHTVERFGRFVGWTWIGVSILYLAAKSLPVLSAPYWWRDGAKENRMIRWRREAEELLAAAHTLDRDQATRTRLGPIVAAVAFSAVPSLLVDEVEIVAPSSAHAGHVRIKIRSFDSDGMGALATFGAMVGMGFERCTGRKIRLDPRDLKIPYSLDGEDHHGGESIRAILIAPLRWEEWR